MDLQKFLEEFHDHLAPRLDTYEQAIYLYVFRHGRLRGSEEVTIGFKSARKRIARGIGKNGTPPSEHVVYEKLRSLAGKGCLQIVRSEQDGTRIRLHLPAEIPGLVPGAPVPPVQHLEDLDFFAVEVNRLAILERDQRKCFYCLRSLDAENYVIEHVVSRPKGSNGYQNVVAACRGCNNRKGKLSAEDFVRVLYREGYLKDGELELRLTAIRRLIAGELKPSMPRMP